MKATHLRRFTSPGHAAARFVAQRMILRPIVWRLATVTVHGTENVKGLERPFIVVANHSSHLDAPLVTGALPRASARYLAAAAAADYFFDVAWRRSLTALFFNAFPVDRTGGGSRSGLAKELVSRGVPLLIFPQGGRGKTEEIGQFKAGAAVLSITSGAPVVPIALVGASTAMPRGRNWPVPGRKPVTVVIGAPMHAASGETGTEFSARIQREVTDMHRAYSPDPDASAPDTKVEQ
ncbi:1-acyl-sn-glycerol-3-phosphate acyltransferase [Conyzicola lurida]|uniref:1-acyl-sn-glycerol-3-phosphate acyltransferase n=1 Tax=Conyzicola lurida TaxID=1172621 RepID=A0A841AP87_9MICO|nr:lysophospholipid acyltransferase family protein [Conyzicola lurida]MBB5844124.1 1-acyl-sn-glycerol-3-phosphate acyltransferase [Conyzicola lurida]